VIHKYIAVISESLNRPSVFVGINSIDYLFMTYLLDLRT